MRWLSTSCTNISASATVYGCDNCTVNVVSSSSEGACYLTLQYAYYNSSTRTTHTSSAACGSVTTAWFLSLVDTHYPSASGKIADLQMYCGSTIFDHICQVRAFPVPP